MFTPILAISIVVGLITRRPACGHGGGSKNRTSELILILVYMQLQECTWQVN